MIPSDQRLDSRDAGGPAAHRALWVVQVLLAVVFWIAGWLKLGAGGANPLMTWTADVPRPLVYAIGVAELLGSLGLLLPAITRIAPAITPLAATGLTTVMALAVVFHAYRGDGSFGAVPAALGFACLLVAWGRYRRAPILQRAGRMAR